MQIDIQDILLMGFECDKILTSTYDFRLASLMSLDLKMPFTSFPIKSYARNMLFCKSARMLMFRNFTSKLKYATQRTRLALVNGNKEKERLLLGIKNINEKIDARKKSNSNKLIPEVSSHPCDSIYVYSAIIRENDLLLTELKNCERDCTALDNNIGEHYDYQYERIQNGYIPIFPNQTDVDVIELVCQIYDASEKINDELNTICALEIENIFLRKRLTEMNIAFLKEMIQKNDVIIGRLSIGFK